MCMAGIMLTSGFNFEGYKIKKYLGFCSGECALGTGFLSSLGAGLADFLGSNSSMYEGKLSQAKSMAIAELERSAMALGANAVIGLDVDYTTFSADIMGVVANGTAVIIEEIINPRVNIYEEDRIIEFPIINYYENLVIRPFSLTLNIKTKEVQISIYSYKEIKLSAMNIDIIGNTIFGTTYEYPDINCVDCALNDGVIKTENVLLDIPANHLKAIRSFTVKINYYIFAGKVYSVDEDYQISDMPFEKLLDFRKAYGNEVVSDFHDHFSYWICMCGHKNEENTNVCIQCGRRKRVYGRAINSKTIRFEELLPELEKLHNCREIVEYLTNIEQEQGQHFPEKVMEEMKKITELEKMYGNMKDSCISKIKKYIMENE